MSEPLIRRGEQVIVDGKLICEVKHDLYEGSLCQPSDFQWFITPPISGEPMDKIPGFRSRPPYGQPDVLLNGQWLSERLQGERPMSSLVVWEGGTLIRSDGYVQWRQDPKADAKNCFVRVSDWSGEMVISATEETLAGNLAAAIDNRLRNMRAATED